MGWKNMQDLFLYGTGNSKPNEVNTDRVTSPPWENHRREKI